MTDIIEPWIRYMRPRDSTLTDAECDVLRGAISEVIDVPAHADMVREHDQPAHSHLLVEGWACRYIHLEDGRRQIVAFHIAGDFVDMHSFPIRVMDHSVAALTPCKVARAPHDNLRRISELEPHLSRLFWLGTLIDAALLRQWLLNVGRRSALESAAHLVCELYARLQIVGMTEGRSFTLPITQAEIGDALGVSSVHVNRIIQDLKGRGILTWRGRAVEVLDWERLQALAEWDATYLNLEDMPR